MEPVSHSVTQGSTRVLSCLTPMSRRFDGPIKLLEDREYLITGSCYAEYLMVVILESHKEFLIFGYPGLQSNELTKARVRTASLLVHGIKQQSSRPHSERYQKFNRWPY